MRAWEQHYVLPQRYGVNRNCHLLPLGHEERLALHSIIMHSSSLIFMLHGPVCPPRYPYSAISRL
jgi:hypothetical protein